MMYEGKRMKGLALSRFYYNEIFLPECRKRIPSAEEHFAAGLVGEGSECFGFDDELSQDHSFGLRLCVWMTQEDYALYGADLNALWRDLPQTFMGYKRPAENINEGKRNGVFLIEEFYKRLLGGVNVPENLRQWLAIEEPYLAAATNGEIFSDQPGRFTAVRNRLLEYFPDDVIRYYLAQHAAIAAQTGQYNFLRAHCHGEGLAANNMKARFAYSVIAMVFLLNKTYRPFYKWAPRAMRSLPILGSSIHDKLLMPSNISNVRDEVRLIEDICASLLAEMRNQGYTSGQSDFLMDHLPEIMGRIEAPEIRNMGIMMVF